MKTLYWECYMGAAGDMLMASLLELHENPPEFVRHMNEIGIPGVSIQAAPSVKCGITGTHVSVTVNSVDEESVDVPPGGADGGKGHSHAHLHAQYHIGTNHPSPPHTHSHTHAHKHDEHLNHDHNHNHEHIHNHGQPANHEHTHGHAHSSVHGYSGHEHRGLDEISGLIESLSISRQAKADALGVYRLLAEAEGHVHGVPACDIHFHEVGTMDALADIVGVCLLMEALGPELVLASPIHVGCGQVRCAHGILPVPAPAAAYLLQGIPIYGGQVRGELCTPTGAALLKYFVRRFEDMPRMTVTRVGYGMGRKDFAQANCVRAFWGETGRQAEEVTELICNLDDMTPEAVAFVQQLLLDEGALDVYTAPIGMKKGRTGILFTCMCRRDSRDKLLTLLFRHTSTLGIRENTSRRYTLHRQTEVKQTPYGPVRVKSAAGYGAAKTKPEYEDIAKIARENDLTLAQVIQSLEPRP